MQFKQAIVKSVKADFGKGTITLSFAISTDEQEAAEELAFFIGKDAGDLILDIMPKNPPMGFVKAMDGIEKRKLKEE
jgi:hypothetical protein